MDWQGILYIAIPPVLTLLGIIIKDSKKDAVHEERENARFEKIEAAIESNQRESNIRSEFIIKEIKSDITRLEHKQEKYNNLQERTAINTQAIEALHVRLDKIVGKETLR